MQIKQLEDFIFAKMSKTGLPGVSMALVDGDEVVWSRGFGFARIKTGRPATSRTLYSTGSVTKSFTALAIMQLHEQDKLDLEDPVDQHLDTQLPGVTIRHLLSHTSGIPGLAYAECVIRGVTGAGEHILPMATYRDMLTFLRGAESWRVAKPGEKMYYLNEGYILLGLVVEKCTGMTFADYVQQAILRPLGMDRSMFAQSAFQADKDRAVPYARTDEGPFLESGYAFRRLLSDGGLISNVLDLARYVAMYLGSGTYKQQRVAGQASIASMCRPAIAQNMSPGPFGQPGYGFGLTVLPDFMGNTLIGHSGSVGTATAYIGFIPAAAKGVAVLANSSGYSTTHMGMYGLAALVGAEPGQLPFVQRENILDSLTGMYETFHGTMSAEIRWSEDILYLISKDKYTSSRVALIPGTVTENEVTGFSLAGSSRIPFAFRLHGSDIRLIHERYCLRRSGPLPPAAKGE